MTNVPATEADNDPMRQFRDRITAKIRGDIGNLMPDEMLQKLVSDAINAELYRDTNTRHFGGPKPWLQEHVREVMGGKVKEAIQKELDRREKEMRTMIAEEIRTRIPEMISEVLVSMLRGHTSGLEIAIQNMIMR
ncbi:hypothetical protein [Roseovarius nitratireducens]|uniref:hypothetical protein n=1 Tax=Roseovarius nitratireducens TaxID=2044597 RepID=UPI000CE1A9A5|nr:hypothetical protein [Roseovarius nitratireducens]